MHLRVSEFLRIKSYKLQKKGQTVQEYRHCIEHDVPYTISTSNFGRFLNVIVFKGKVLFSDLFKREAYMIIIIRKCFLWKRSANVDVINCAEFPV